jgi:hypothetical protein
VARVGPQAEEPMKLLTTAFAIPVLLAAAVTAQAACTYPQSPQKLPNGASATKDEMLAAQRVMKEYTASVEGAYLSCLEKEKTDAVAQLDTTDAAAYEKQKASLDEVHAKKHNAAVDELQATAARWNDEIKAFQAKNKP